MRKPALLVMFCISAACGDGTLVVGDDSHGLDVDAPGSNNASTALNAATSGSIDPTNGTPTPNNSMPDPTPTNNMTVTDTTGPTNSETTAPTNNMTPGPEFHPMFVAVADFMREKCVACHDQGQNGNLVVPSADVSNAELRVNLEGVVATTGRLLVEPNDPAESQIYIMITNAAGEQFDAPTLAVVEDWINAGAPYDP